MELLGLKSDSLLHDAAGSQISPLHYAAGRQISRLHFALCSRESKIPTALWLPAASCSGESDLTAAFCSGESNLTAAWCNGESNLTAWCSWESIWHRGVKSKNFGVCTVIPQKYSLIDHIRVRCALCIVHCTRGFQRYSLQHVHIYMLTNAFFVIVLLLGRDRGLFCFPMCLLVLLSTPRRPLLCRPWGVLG
jgi:hypothetical protein